ncbi:MAG: 4-alpha-glucanotransferase [Treponema sp.]|jgi:4-alpha-glucanotransferase|nr:4-alpha-glucanotransferase [Treponema sp.]
MASKQGIDLNKRQIGVVVPVGALRGKNSIGVGEFPDLVEFAGLCAKLGLGLIQLLPVNDTGSWSSPYFAITVFALHPIYLRIADLPEVKGAGTYTRQLEALALQFDKLTRFPFEKIFRAKLGILHQIYDDNRAAIARKAAPGGSLARWIDENPWVQEYAVYRRLKDGHGEKSWQEWGDHQDTGKADIEALWQEPGLRGEHLFYVWVQEALDAQFRAAAKAVRDQGIILEGDLPILINEDSCDVWAHRDYFRLDLSAGAPPDMYSPEGQNWGFPLYNWEALAKNDFDWWRNRLRNAGKYFAACRIDHVLGFFRIWATGRRDSSSALGRFIPYVPVKRGDLAGLGWDQGRIHWASRPHISTAEVWDALRDALQDALRDGSFTGEDIALEAGRVFSLGLDRIGNEELWLFKETVKGEKDIAALGLHPAAAAFLCQAWRDRLFLEYEPGFFFPTWFYRSSRAYASLSDEERDRLEALLEKRRVESEKIWEAGGEKLLAMLCESSAMLPCAEDLGAVPDCVPRVLSKLHILGLRVVRWFRDWDQPGEPYVPFDEYPELSVCTPAVHDSSTLREWWEREAGQDLFCRLIGVPSLPKVYNPGAAKTILQKIAASASRFRVFQIQDLLHLSPTWYAEDCASERVNVPGSLDDFNWTYRLPASLADIAADGAFVQAVQELAAVKPVQAVRGAELRARS